MRTIHPKKHYTRDFRVRRPLELEEYSYYRLVDGMFAGIGFDVELKPRERDSLGVSLITQQQLSRADEKSRKLRNCSSLTLRTTLKESLPETAAQRIQATVLRAFTYSPVSYRTYLGLELEAPEIKEERSALSQTLMELAEVEISANNLPIHVTLGAAKDGQRLEDSLDRVGQLVGDTLVLQPIAFAKGIA